eukprot:TRINITY_DN9126_c0_g1_i10.p1 TRINITY_DN9126_c0_g1~~TRINITY_DN9126_c0_g1_i10.p1  ORF type:complete len:608 (-),score=98.48 TRINITY_DN9126_c0_g1_i10:101-1846(-)
MEIEKFTVQTQNGDNQSGAAEVKIHPIFFDFPVKITDSSSWKGTDAVDYHHFLQDWVNRSHSHSISAEELLKQMTKIRSSTLYHIERQDIDLKRYTDYISLLSSILDFQISQAPKEQVANKENTGSSEEPKQFDVDKFSNAVSFSWREVLFPLADDKIQFWGITYEIVQMLLAIALVLVQKATQIMRRQQDSGINTVDSQQIYAQYLDAGGICKHILDKYVDTMVTCPAMDCQKQTVTALMNFFMAEAQHITVLRAISKGNHPSLISSLASDTADLFSAAGEKLQEIVNMQLAFQRKSYTGCGIKLQAYISFKSYAMTTIAYSYNGLRLLGDGEGGGAVKSCEYSSELLKGDVTSAAKTYTKTLPLTSTAQYAQFIKVIEVQVSTNLSKCKKDNDSVYFQKVAEQTPSLGEPKRLIKVQFPISIVPNSEVRPEVMSAFQPPRKWDKSRTRKQMEAATLVTTDNKQEAGDQVQEEKKEKQPTCYDSGCCLFLRWLLVIIMMPILVIISLVGCIIWIIFLPFKIICCPIACCIQIIWNIVEWIIKAPFRATLWAAGKPWQPAQQQQEKHEDEDQKKKKAENKV